MNVVEVAGTLHAADPGAIMVSSLGTATAAVREVTGDAAHFYFGAAMGCALGGALGLAEALPQRRIVALIGDGDFLMGAGSLWSLSACRPPNLLVVVLADGAYAITGGQPIASELRLARVARELPDLAGVSVASQEELFSAVRRLPRPGVVEAAITERVRPGASPFVDPPDVMRRLRSRLAAEPVVGVPLHGSTIARP